MENVKIGKKNLLGIFIFVEVLIIFFLFVSMSPLVSSGTGQNVTVQTFLEVGSVYPEVLAVSIDANATEVILTANATKEVSCAALIRDYNEEVDFQLVQAELYNVYNVSFGAADDNNTHYTNYSCEIINDSSSWGISDDEYHAIANCTFQVEYYANAGSWNCSLNVSDWDDQTDRRNESVVIAELLAIGLPTSIDYGIVNSTYVSDEKVINVTNVGNTLVNLTLKGYAQTEGDGYAMNCSIGASPFIDIGYEKYNLTDTTSGGVSLSEADNLYINLTGSDVINEFNLDYRQNDAFNDALNSSYWRIYVPKGVAGTCQGNIVFGAVKAAA